MQHPEKVQIDRKSLESAENRLKNVLSDFERQGYRMKNGGYVDKRISFYSILCAVISLLFACFMCYLWTDAAKDQDNYKQYYEYFQEQAREQRKQINSNFTNYGNNGTRRTPVLLHTEQGCEVRRRNHPCRPKRYYRFEAGRLGRLSWACTGEEKLSSEEIQQQMKELGVEMEIVPLI